VKEALTLAYAIAPQKYDSIDYQGVIIVFPSGTKYIKILNSYFDIFENFGNKWSNKSTSIDKEQEEGYKGGLCVGNLFEGSYNSDNGYKFDDKSIAVEFVGVNSKELKELAKLIVQEFSQETVLLKDLHKNKIYLVNKQT
jgi:hypothetical protein